MYSFHPTPHSDGDYGTIRFLGLSGDVEVIKFFWSSERLQFGDQVPTVFQLGCCPNIEAKKIFFFFKSNIYNMCNSQNRFAFLLNNL